MDHPLSKQENAAIGEWVQAVIFDLDGVITDTAELHSRAWKQMFDGYLEARSQQRGEPFRPFDSEADYRRFVDGKPRYEGVQSFLASRGIQLDFGSPEDPPERETVCGLGNRKNRIYQEFVESGGVKTYPPAVDMLRRLKAQKIKTAVVSSSKNCRKVIEAANIADLFDVRVDGEVSAARGLAGKPAPDIFLAAAADLKVAPDRAVVFEDALSGVEAARSGHFGSVIGVDRTGRNHGLKAHGADRVVSDLATVDLADLPRRRQTTDLPSALQRTAEIGRWLDGGQTALFLDYDGTLTPIVAQPDQAVLSEAMRETLRTLAETCTVAIVSGRGLDDVRQRVALENMTYAGSHGFEIDGPNQTRLRNEKGAQALPALDAAEKQLHNRLADIEGALVERKRFSIAVHYRNVAAAHTDAVADIVDEVLYDHDGLRKGHGKKVFELQPDVAWDKGHAVRWLLRRLDLDEKTVRPIYIGDDVTDEDAFRVLQESGLGIVVHGRETRSTYARYGLADPEEVQTFLQQLSTQCGGGA
jgi:alpha,alpha-trehalase